MMAKLFYCQSFQTSSVLHALFFKIFVSFDFYIIMFYSGMEAQIWFGLRSLLIFKLTSQANGGTYLFIPTCPPQSA